MAPSNQDLSLKSLSFIQLNPCTILSHPAGAASHAALAILDIPPIIVWANSADVANNAEPASLAVFHVSLITPLTLPPTVPSVPLSKLDANPVVVLLAVCNADVPIIATACIPRHAVSNPAPITSPNFMSSNPDDVNAPLIPFLACSYCELTMLRTSSIDISFSLSTIAVKFFNAPIPLNVSAASFSLSPMPVNIPSRLTMLVLRSPILSNVIFKISNTGLSCTWTAPSSVTDAPSIFTDPAEVVVSPCRVFSSINCNTVSCSSQHSSSAVVSIKPNDSVSSPANGSAVLAVDAVTVAVCDPVVTKSGSNTPATRLRSDSDKGLPVYFPLSTLVMASVDSL